jgi:lipoprotein-releasing system permease protein
MIIGSLSMLILEKKKDIAILKAMGATSGFIRFLFLLEGIFTSTIGAVVGLFLGILLVILQINFGIVPLPQGQFVVSSYPVRLEWADIVITFGIVVIISVIASWYPAKRAAHLTDTYRAG